MQSHPSAFGAYVREAREQAKFSLRQVANKLGVSHVYLGEVERGVRGPMDQKHWPILMKTIPGITKQNLVDTAKLSRPYRFKIPEGQPKYKDLTLAFARRIEDADLSDSEIENMLKMLRGDKGDEDE